MRVDSDRYHRRSIRLKDYNYTQAGAYFITVCTYERECIFGNIVDEEMWSNEFGKIVAACWYEIPNHFECAELDAFVVMPNHVHGIVVITDTIGATHASPLQKPRGPERKSIGAIIGAFKSASTKRINEIRQASATALWQRNYYDHVIRNDDVWNCIREYIHTNPARWAEDVDNPACYDRRQKTLDMKFKGIFTEPRHKRNSAAR